MPAPNPTDLDTAARTGATAAGDRAARATAPGPLVWAIESYRAGETTQILGLAEAVVRTFGGALETIRYRHKFLSGPLSLAQAVGMQGVTDVRPRPFGPPWPDLLISAGVRNEPVARWIRAASGGQTRIVFLGRVWAPARAFDLVVVTPQYRFPAGPTVLENETTLHRVHGERLATERARWAHEFAALPSPRILALVGGDSGPFALRGGAARALGAALDARARATGGSVLVSTSSRTHAEAVAGLDAALPSAYRYHYRAGDPQNPYFGMLAWADEIVVTSDSIAMISEALAAGVPVALFDLARGADRTPKSRAYSLLMRLGPERLSRDIGIAHQRLLASGRIGLFGAPPVRSAAVDPSLANTLDRIAGLLGTASAPRP